MRRTLTLATVSGAAAGIWTGRHVSAPTVRLWRPSPAPKVMAGRLCTRAVGTGAAAIVLLHGIVGCGDYYGTSYDDLADGRHLVAPDLLGFGDSYRSAAPSGYGIDAHLDALDEMATALNLTGPLVIAGHSMGAVLALHWASRRPAQVQSVIAMSAPLYFSTSEGLAHVRGLGRLESWMALDTPVARAACASMCRHRMAASWVAAALKPHLPIHLSRRGVLHTWPAYLATMEQVVLHSGWHTALPALAAARVPIVLAAGDRDPVPVKGRAAMLAEQFPAVRVVAHPTADHDLPLAEPIWCHQLLRSALV